MSRSSLLALCASTLLLAACPTDPGPGTNEEGSTGIPSLTEGMTSAPMTTEVDGSTTAVMTSEGTSSSSSGADSSSTSGSSGPPPECAEDSDCQDDSFCNGLEVCAGGSCMAGKAPVCDDAIDCTLDSCDDAEGACVHEPDNGLCGCAETCDETLGCGNHCVPALCQGQIYLCGNCIDDDGDCGVDSLDSDCWGPCHNNESGWSGEVPGQQNQSECNVMDCYFDQNSGGGNDECYWSHSCDPLEPTGCTYNPNTNIPGTGQSCAELQMMQDPICIDYCAPLVPNGCDCFGCCQVETALGLENVYLGTYDDGGVGTCNLDVVDDPVLCNRCTQVDACLNTCEMCELCLGQQELPPGCDEGQDCPEGLQACGLPGQDPCPMGQACVTGCCVPNPQ